MAILVFAPVYALIAHLTILPAEVAVPVSGSAVSPAVLVDVNKKGTGWTQIDTGYFDIYYEDGVDLGSVERHLRKRIYLFGPSAPGDMNIEGKIGYRLNALFVRTKDILDMHPQMPKLKIKIYKSEDGLNNEYHQLSGDSGAVKAFYVRDLETLFTSEDTISDSVLSHEIAHTIIDHYFAIVPSTKGAEVLASYVDMHISD